MKTSRSTRSARSMAASRSWLMLDALPFSVSSFLILNNSSFIMCRNIKTLHNFAPPATEEEIRASSLQFVRKLSGFTRPSKANENAFNRAIEKVTLAAQELLDSLVTNAPPRDRETEAIKARARSTKRFAAAPVAVMAGHNHS